jgi:hypothetical protein
MNGTQQDGHALADWAFPAYSPVVMNRSGSARTVVAPELSTGALGTTDVSAHE